MVGAIIISVLQSRKLGLRHMCLRHMAGEYGGWIGGQAVLAPAAEISGEPPGPPLSIQIKPRRNKHGPIQTLWLIEAEKREKHHVVEVI